MTGASTSLIIDATMTDSTGGPTTNPVSIAQGGTGATTLAGAQADLGIAPVFNVTAYGAVADERLIFGGSITSGQNTLTASPGSFSPSDALKVITVNMGARILAAASYTSGGSITGSAGQTVNVTFSNGATGIVKLTGTNTIAGATAILILTGGSSSVTTTATLSNGTATASGSATVGGISYFDQPVQTTATYVDSSTLTLGTNATNTETSSAQIWIGTDNSTAINNAILAALAAGGGTVYFPASANQYLILSQLSIPSTNGAIAPLSFKGEGGNWDGTLFGSTTTQGASVIDLRYSTSGAKINTTGDGILTIKNMGLANNGYDNLPFIQTTNTILNIQENSFYGCSPGSGQSQNDAIHTGTNAIAFVGYGTVIKNNYFQRIARCIYGQFFSNQILFIDNTVAGNCGGLAPMEFDGTAGASTNNIWSGNLVQANNYQYGIYLTSSTDNFGGGTTFWDKGANFVSAMYLTGVSTGNGAVGCDVNPGTGFTYTDIAGTNTPFIADKTGFTLPYLQNLSFSGGGYMFGDATGQIRTAANFIPSITGNFGLGIPSLVWFNAYLGSGGLNNTGPLNGNFLNLSISGTSVGGSTSGTALFVANLRGGSKKSVLIYCAALLGTATFSFPVAFTFTPVIVTASGTNALAGGLVTSLSTTAMTITGTTSTGYLFIEGL